MNATTILFLVFGISGGLILLLHSWNFFARRYNDRLLANSTCRLCNTKLGPECIPAARRAWKEQLQSTVKDEKVVARWSNLELQCPNCGAINLERDLFMARKQRADG